MFICLSNFAFIKKLQRSVTLCIKFALLLLLLLVARISLAAEIVKIDSEKNFTRIRVTLTADVPVKYFTLENPARAVIDFGNTKRSGKIPVIKKNALIKGLRGAQREGDYRLVIDLHQAASINLKEVIDSSNKRSYVRIDIAPENKQSVVKKKSQSDKGKAAIRKSTELDNKKRTILVALDAGHGGSDPGAISKSGIKEKNVVLNITKELERLLDKEPGFFSKNIRRHDRYVGLKKRRDMARDKKVDLFVSIHADAFPDRSVSGASVYVLSRKGASSAMAKFLATNESASDNLGRVDISDKDALLKEVLVDLAMNDKMSTSVGVSKMILKNMQKVAQLHSPRVEKAAFAVLKTPDVPGVLIETGFISNNNEASKLNDVDYQKRLAREIFNGIKEYFYRYPPEGSYIAWQKNQQKK